MSLKKRDTCVHMRNILIFQLPQLVFRLRVIRLPPGARWLYTKSACWNNRSFRSGPAGSSSTEHSAASAFLSAVPRRYAKLSQWPSDILSNYWQEGGKPGLHYGVWQTLDLFFPTATEVCESRASHFLQFILSSQLTSVSQLSPADFKELSGIRLEWSGWPLPQSRLPPHWGCACCVCEVFYLFCTDTFWSFGGLASSRSRCASLCVCTFSWRLIFSSQGPFVSLWSSFSLRGRGPWRWSFVVSVCLWSLSDGFHFFRPFSTFTHPHKVLSCLPDTVTDWRIG